MTTYTFDPVPVYGQVGGLVKLGTRASSTFPVTGLDDAPVSVTQAGSPPAGFVLSNAAGLIPSFTTVDVPSVMVEFAPGVRLRLDSREALEGVADAVAAAEAATAAADAATAALNGKVAKADLPLNVKDYGAVGDGSHDDTAAIQAAVNAAQALVSDVLADGVTVHFPRGKYKVTSTVLVSKSGITLTGEAHGASVITAASSNFDMVKFDHASATLYYCGVRDLHFYSPGGASAGYQLTVKRATYFTAHNLSFNGWFGGMYLARLGKAMFSQIIFSQEARTTSTTGAAIYMASDYGYSSDVHFTDVQIMEDIAYAGATSFMITACDGVYVENLHMHGQLTVNPSGTGNETTVRSLSFVNCYFDGARDPAVLLTGTTTVAYSEIRFTGCYFRGAQLGMRFLASSTVTNVHIADCTFSDNQFNAIDMPSGNVQDILISGCIFSNNNTLNSSGQGDVRTGGDGVHVTDCIFTGGGAAGYGVFASNFSTDQYYSNLNFANSTVGTPVKVGTSAGISARAIVSSWKVKNRGVQSVGAGVTSVVVTHGLGLTPTANMIRLTPQGSCPAYWVSAVSATTFTVSFASATSAFSLGWEANAEY